MSSIGWVLLLLLKMLESGVLQRRRVMTGITGHWPCYVLCSKWGVDILNGWFMAVDGRMSWHAINSQWPGKSLGTDFILVKVLLWQSDWFIAQR